MQFVKVIFFPHTDLVTLHSVYITEPIKIRRKKLRIGPSSNQSNKGLCMSVPELSDDWMGVGWEGVGREWEEGRE